MKVAVDQRGAWETAAPELGQRAGIFKKHGITLDLTYPRAESEIRHLVSNSSLVQGIDRRVASAAAAGGLRAPL